MYGAVGEWLRRQFLWKFRPRFFKLPSEAASLRERMSALLRDFAVLEILTSSSKLTKKDAEKLSRKIKVSAWKRLKPYAH